MRGDAPRTPPFGGGRLGRGPGRVGRPAARRGQLLGGRLLGGGFGRGSELAAHGDHRQGEGDADGGHPQDEEGLHRVGGVGEAAGEELGGQAECHDGEGVEGLSGLVRQVVEAGGGVGDGWAPGAGSILLAGSEGGGRPAGVGASVEAVADEPPVAQDVASVTRRRALPSRRERIESAAKPFQAGRMRTGIN